jgi:predicted  nucleic acid-binding Zn-ribbon protein
MDDHAARFGKRIDETHVDASRQTPEVLGDGAAEFGQMDMRIDSLANEVAQSAGRMDDGAMKARKLTEEWFTRVDRDLAQLDATIRTSLATTNEHGKALRSLLDLTDMNLSRMFSKDDAVTLHAQVETQFREVQSELDAVFIAISMRREQKAQLRAQRAACVRSLEPHDFGTLGVRWDPIPSHFQVQAKRASLRSQVSRFQFSFSCPSGQQHFFSVPYVC